MATIAWESLPAAHVAAIEDRTGPVVKAEPVTGGLMPGLAVIIHAGDGQRYFVKAAPEGNPAHHLYARELAANAAMPDSTPAPRMRWASVDGGWAVMLFDYLDARTADLSPGSDDVPRVLSMLRAVGFAPAWDGTPPVAVHVAGLQVKAAKMLGRLPAGELRDLYAAAVDGFDIGALEGGRLVHYDLHPGNLKITRGGEAVAVDWPFAGAGAPWVDAALLVPRLVTAGHTPGGAERLVSALPAWQAGYDARAVTGLAALWTLFREYKALYGPPDARKARTLAVQAGQAWIRYRMNARVGR